MLVKKKATILKRTTLMALLVLAMGIIFYLLYSSFGPAAPAVRRQTSSSGNVDVSNIDTSFDSSYFNQSPYKDLVQYGNLPVESGSLGRPDPFSELPFHVVVPDEEEEQ